MGAQRMGMANQMGLKGFSKKKTGFKINKKNFDGNSIRGSSNHRSKLDSPRMPTPRGGNDSLSAVKSRVVKFIDHPVILEVENYKGLNKENFDTREATSCMCVVF